MSFYNIETTVSSAVASGGTITYSYPAKTDAGNFENTKDHKLWVAGHQKLYSSPADFTISFGTTSITVTYNGTSSIPANTRVALQLNEIDRSDTDDYEAIQHVIPASLLVIDLGAPDTLDDDIFIDAATGTEAPNTETVTYTPDTDGTSPTDNSAASVVVIDGVNYWELDVPRAIRTLVTHGSSVVAMTITVTGLDIFGNTVVEDIAVAATGTSQTDNGLKAFKWIRSIALTAAADAEANTVNVGFNDVIGLPVRLPDTGYVLKELEDGATASAGTVVAAVDSVATATTGDVRGTYDPNSACDGSKAFKLIAAIPDPTDKGVAQYAG